MHAKPILHRHGTIPILIHWVSAAAIVWLLVSGFRLADTADPIAKADMLRLHVAIGLAVAVLTLIRGAWWIFVERKGSYGDEPLTLQSAAKHVLHALFYIAIIGMAESGIALMTTSGAGMLVFSNSQSLLPDFTAYAAKVPHGLGAWLMIALITLHVSAALYHQFIKKDHIFARMGMGRSGE